MVKIMPRRHFRYSVFMQLYSEIWNLRKRLVSAFLFSVSLLYDATLHRFIGAHNVLLCFLFIDLFVDSFDRIYYKMYMTHGIQVLKYLCVDLSFARIDLNFREQIAFGIIPRRATDNRMYIVERFKNMLHVAIMR